MSSVLEESSNKSEQTDNSTVDSDAEETIRRDEEGIEVAPKKFRDFPGKIERVVEEEWGTTTFYTNDYDEAPKEREKSIESTAARSLVLIFGINGACRGCELVNLKVEDVENHSNELLLVNAKETRTKKNRSFVVHGQYTKIRATSTLSLKDITSQKNISILTMKDKISMRSQIIEAEEEAESDDVKYSLPYFMSCLFATILEDTITEIRILFECNTEMRISKIMSDMNLLLALKYGVAQPTDVDELEGIDPRNLGCTEYKLNKLDSDRKYLHTALVSTYEDLSLNHKFGVLADHVDKILSLDEYRAFLAEEEIQNRVLRRELAKQLRQQRNHIKTVTYETDAIIDELGTQVEDAALNAAVRSRYIDNWQRARTEQHDQTIADKEYSPSHSIEYHKQRTDQEQRVHSEVELLINIAIGETLGKVEEWMEKYDTDIEAIDLKIQFQKNDYKNMLDKRVSLEDTIEKHDRQMKEWVGFKGDREEERQYVEKMTTAAIAVQAWWRGILVRCELGPFRVSKRKRDKKRKPKPKPKGKK